MIRIKEKEKCCGCTACYSICPKKCIKMVEDSEGFLYPEVNITECIECHACERVCPISNKHGEELKDTWYTVIQNTNEKIRYESTAGGVFSTLAEQIFAEGGVVFAVGYDDNSNVVHKKATISAQLKEMRGSKYVQSDLLDIFTQVKACLDDKVKTLFVGTPCQVHGLINYVGKSEFLYTIDLLCLGVSSPGLFRRYISYLNQKYHKKVASVEFRNKYFGYATPNVRINFTDGKFLQQRYDAKVHANLFFKGHRSARPSCYECEFREIPRVSDFTIGDCVSIGSIDKSMDDNLGTTKCWIHTAKGRALLKAAEDKKMLVLEEHASNIQGGPKKQIPYPKDRELFFTDGFSMEYAKFIHKWQPCKVKDSVACIVRYILHYIPFGTAVSKKLRQRQAKLYEKKVKQVN